jgi:hypothetical protein
MVLASAMDKDRHTCFWRWKTLLHYTKLSRSTLAAALNVIETSGIITRTHRYRQSNIYVWHPDIAERLRNPVTQEADAQDPETDDGNIDPEVRAVFLAELRSMFIPQTDRTKPYEEEWLEFVADKDESNAIEILNWMLAENREHRLQESFPDMGTEQRGRRFKGITALKEAWTKITEAFASARQRAIAKAFEVEEEIS